MKLTKILVESIFLDMIDEYQIQMESLINQLEDGSISVDNFKENWKSISNQFEQSLKINLKQKNKL